MAVQRYDKPPSAVQKISPHHRKAILMSALGRRPGEIARELGVTVPWISQLMNSPVFRLHVERIQKSIESEATASQVDVLLGHVPEAIRKVKSLMDSAEEEQVQLSAAKDILDRTIPKKTAHTEERIMKLDIPGNVLALLAKVIAEDDNRDIEIDETQYERKGIDSGKNERQMIAKMPEEIDEVT